MYVFASVCVCVSVCVRTCACALIMFTHMSIFDIVDLFV